MPDDSEATVGRIAAQLGVTVRTLHHWDRIGLARPSLRSAADYRLYSEADRVRLERVLLYRELGLGLAEIGGLLDGDPVEARVVLRAQRSRLDEERKRLGRLIEEVDRVLVVEAGGSTMSAEQQVEVLGAGWDPRWSAEAHHAHGGTEQWLQYAERAAKRSSVEWRSTVAATSAVEHSLAAAMAAGAKPESVEVRELVERHREAFSAWFPLTRSMQVCLGRRYECAPGFAEHYERLQPGLPAWLRRAIDASAREHGIDPETARWE